MYEPVVWNSGDQDNFQQESPLVEKRIAMSM